MALDDSRSWSFNDDGTDNNAQVGAGGIDGGRDRQTVYQESSTQNFPLGARRSFPDGRSFRYAEFGAAANAGLLVSQDISATCLAETNDIVIAASGAFSPAADSTKLQITLASITADDYAGGYLHVTDDAGEGYQYRIQSNSATDATTSGKVDIYLYDPIVTTLTTASDIAITGNLWNGVIGCTAGTDYIMSGVTARTMQSGYFGWVQTTGVATILADGTIAIGDNLTLSDGVTGAVQLKDAEVEPLVGFALFAPDDTGHVGVRLYGLE